MIRIEDVKGVERYENFSQYGCIHRHPQAIAEGGAQASDDTHPLKCVSSGDGIDLNGYAIKRR